MPKITVEHILAKKIISKLEDEGVDYSTASDSSEARSKMPTHWSAGTNGLGVKTTIKVSKNDAVLFDRVCMDVFGVGQEQEVPERKLLRESWPFSIFFKNG